MKILIIEDETEIRDFLQTSFESECFVVDTASDGESGWELLKVNSYDVVILDNILPKKSGESICRDMRAMGNTTPILILSVVSEVTAKVELLNNGGDDYLDKPFSFLELLARVHALARRPRKMEHEILTIGPLSLNPHAHVVTWNASAIKLTRKEFVLLEYLMRNAGNVLSRGMIMEHVWDMNADPFSNTIESHIVSLRKKIDTQSRFNQSIIKTVSGRGYKLELVV